MGNGYVTKHFLQSELDCPCCRKCEMQPEFLQKLEWLRLKYGKGIVPSSAYRCPKHNQAVGGKPDSYHMKGRAIDIPLVVPADRYNLVRCALELRLTVIVYDTFIHVDNRSEPMILIG